MSLTKFGNLDEHGLSASDIVIETGMPEPVEVLPRPYSQNPVGEGVIGVDTQRLNAGKAPRSIKKDENIIYANELPPAPRSQLNIPFPMKGIKRQYKKVFKQGRCYNGYSKEQNVAAFTCSDGGLASKVDSNGKEYRGNQFASVWNTRGLGTGLGRDMDIVASGRVGEAKKQIDRPTVMEGQSLFYPYPSFGNRYYPLYKVYPDTTQYTIDGMPYYSNEDKGLVGGRADMKLKNDAKELRPDTEYGVKEMNDIIENFESGSDSVSVMIATIIIVVVTLIILRKC